MASQQPQGEFIIKAHGLLQWLTLTLIQRCAADGDLATALYDHVSFMESSLSTVDLRSVLILLSDIVAHSPL